MWAAFVSFFAYYFLRDTWPIVATEFAQPAPIAAIFDYSYRSFSFEDNDFRSFDEGKWADYLYQSMWDTFWDWMKAIEDYWAHGWMVQAYCET